MGALSVFFVLCIFCFVRPDVILSFLPLTLGIVILVDGIGKLRPAVRYGLYVIFLAAMLLLIPKTAAAPFIYFQF